MRGTNSIIYLCFSLLIIGFIHIVQAKEFIWRIGDPDNGYEEFSWPETEVIDYLVPLNWEEILTDDNPNWGGFPRHLCTSYGNEHGEDEKGLQKIGINFPYSFDSHNPILMIRAETSALAPDVNFDLEIMKFNQKINLDLRRMNNHGFSNYEFPLGLITAGDINVKNEIVIRCTGPPNGYIVFDALYLYYDNTDTDQDGVWDSDEGDAKSDPRTASLPKTGRDRPIKKFLRFLSISRKGQSLIFEIYALLTQIPRQSLSILSLDIISLTAF